MLDEIIERAEVFVVGPDVERYSWAEGMSGQYMVNIVLRLTAKSGLQGISGAAMINAHSFDRSVGETLRYLLPDMIGQSPAEREMLWHRHRNLGTPQVPQAPPQPTSQFRQHRESQTTHDDQHRNRQHDPDVSSVGHQVIRSQPESGIAKGADGMKHRNPNSLPQGQALIFGQKQDDGTQRLDS